jgi:4-amino-4-deoxy-L-arabinose transferase-like glycosyltransferase
MNSTPPQQNEQDSFADKPLRIRPATSKKTTQSVQSPPRFFFSPSEWALLALLAIIAFIPRLILALQLDVYTDEPIYVTAGNWYILLVKQLNITSPHWLYNNEHPAFAKLLMGISIYISHYFHAPNMLFQARIPSILLGTALVVGVYALGRAPFGRTVALLAALSLALSPWVVYFSSLALLDMTMTALITLAYLLTWHAILHPRLYALSGVLIGLAGASKYPAALIVPAIPVFIAYYYTILRRRLPVEQRLALPWRWWLLGLCLIPVSFFIADPPIWLDPLHRLLTSLQFSIGHADSGHATFWAGQVYTHVPSWMIFYVLFAKVSAFVTLPALFFIIFAALQLFRFHWPGQQKRTGAQTSEQIQAIAGTAFLFIWLVDALLLFSQLTILVGTHYYLPVAAPLFLAGASSLTVLVSVLLGRFFANRPRPTQALVKTARPEGRSWQAGLLFPLLALALVGPHLLGLINTPDADGYTSEFFQGEDSSLEVMYAGYHEADEWLMTHSKTGGTVGIVGGSATVLWYISNPRAVGKFRFVVTTYGKTNYPFDYLVWPMNLLQRDWGPTTAWSAHVVHKITGGETLYCLIMARDPSSVIPYSTSELREIEP